MSCASCIVSAQKFNHTVLVVSCQSSQSMRANITYEWMDNDTSTVHHLTSPKCADVFKALGAKLSLFSVTKKISGIMPLARRRVVLPGWVLPFLFFSATVAFLLLHVSKPQIAVISCNLCRTDQCSRNDEKGLFSLLLDPWPGITSYLLFKWTTFYLVEFLALATPSFGFAWVQNQNIKWWRDPFYTGVFINENPVRTLLEKPLWITLLLILFRS